MADPVTAATVGAIALKGLATAAPGVGGVVGEIAGEKLDPTSKGILAQQRQDVRKLRQGTLGWTGAQKAQTVGDARRQIDAAAKSSEADLRREAAASGGFGRSGAQQDQAAAIYDAKAAGVAEAVKGADALSQQQALTAAQAIRADALARSKEMAARGSRAGTAAGEGLKSILGDTASALNPTIGAQGLGAANVAAS